MKQTGVELIAQERKEQIEKHGRTIENDVIQYKYDELTQAAIASIEGNRYKFPKSWQESEWPRKISDKCRKDRLIIAGALIAAEIDRIQAK